MIEFDELDREEFQCCVCLKTGFKSIDGTWPKCWLDGTPAVTFNAMQDDDLWLSEFENFVCYDCLE